MRHEIGIAMASVGVVGVCRAVTTLVRGEAVVDER